MNEEQKAWYKQFWSQFGAREFVRLAGFFIPWFLLGFAVIYLLGTAAFVIYFCSILVFAYFWTRWKPAYTFMRKYLNNKNLPIEPYPRSTSKPVKQPHPWWSFLPGFWWIMIDLVLLFFVLRYLLK